MVSQGCSFGGLFWWLAGLLSGVRVDKITGGCWSGSYNCAATVMVMVLLSCGLSVDDGGGCRYIITA